MIILYTVPSGKTAVITSINHCNHTNSTKDVYSYIKDTTTNTNEYTIIDIAELTPNTSLELIGSGQKIVLNESDALTVLKLSNAHVDTIVTLMEID
jgi:hypothetical protein